MITSPAKLVCRLFHVLSSALLPCRQPARRRSAGDKASVGGLGGQIRKKPTISEVRGPDKTLRLSGAVRGNAVLPLSPRGSCTSSTAIAGSEALRSELSAIRACV